MNALFPLLPVERQLFRLTRLVQVFNPEYADAALSSLTVPEGYAGLVALPKVTNFGIYQIPASNEVWGKYVPNLRLRTLIEGLGRGAHTSFRADDFELTHEIREAIDRLKATQGHPGDRGFDENRLRVFPIRFSNEIEPELREGEFFLDLASHMWLLAVHYEAHVAELTEILFHCRGEKHRGEDLVIGHHHNQRVIKHWESKYAGAITAIGYVPADACVS